MSKPVKPSTLLTRAAKWIEENGWIQHSFWKYRNGRDPYKDTFNEALEVAREKGCRACVRGALYVVDEPGLEPEERESRHTAATWYVASVVDSGGWDGWEVASWNDQEGRTKDEVVQALKDAAKAARKDGK